MAGFVPPEVIDEIVSKADIVEVISQYVPLKKMGKNYVGLCPFHSEDTPSFTVTPDKQIFYCFGCQKGGNVLHFIKEVENLTLPEAATRLAATVGVPIPEKERSPEEIAQSKEKQDLYDIHELAAKFYTQYLHDPQTGRLACKYLEKRNLSQAIIDRFCLGYAPSDDWEALSVYLLSKNYSPNLLEKSGLCSRSNHTGKYYDKFHGRLIFPIFDYRGKVIAFGGRVIGEGEPKYLNSTQTPIYNKGQQLYALNIAGVAIRQTAAAVIMEGYMDVLMAHQYGVTNAVASLGTAFTVDHARLIKRYTTNVYLAYDGDAAGMHAARRGLDILCDQGIDVKLITLPNNMDPDDFMRLYGKEGWDDLLANKALPVLEYLLQLSIQKNDIKTTTGKSAVVKELVPAITKTKSMVERESFIRMLAEKLQVSQDVIYADLRKSGLSIVIPQKKTGPFIKTTVAGTSPGLVAEYQLLYLMLENKTNFERVIRELGVQFSQNPLVERILLHVDGIKEEYDWNPATLLHRFSDGNEAQNEGLCQFLLKLLQTEIPKDEQERDKIVDEYTRGFLEKQPEQEYKLVNEALARGDGDEEQLLIRLGELMNKLPSSGSNNR